jgi:Txe/YoeB family toxin of Txe-Axe toxin-antitoxin module
MANEISVNTSKVHSMMRSLFRLLGFKEMQSPEILIQQEQEIFSRRISELNSEEISYFVDNWSSYYKHQLVQQELDDHHLVSQIERELLDLN